MQEKRCDKSDSHKFFTRKMVVVLVGLLALTGALALRWADPEGLKIARFLVPDSPYGFGLYPERSSFNLVESVT